MAVDEGPTATVADEQFVFCSEGCRDLFEREPDRYLEDPHPHLERPEGVTVPRLPASVATGEFTLDIADPEALAVGDRVSFTKTLGEKEVRLFAEATSDTNALHLNEEFAEDTRFEGRIVHGTLVSGLVSAALACFPGLTIYVSQSLGFRRPVRLGEQLTATCTIADDLRDSKYELETTIENADREDVLTGTATVIVDELPGSTV